MKTPTYERLPLPSSMIPKEYTGRTMAGEHGGVFLVFITAKNDRIAKIKVRLLKQFCKTLGALTTEP
jgi:hypothetical protein